MVAPDVAPKLPARLERQPVTPAQTRKAAKKAVAAKLSRQASLPVVSEPSVSADDVQRLFDLFFAAMGDLW